MRGVWIAAAELGALLVAGRRLALAEIAIHGTTRTTRASIGTAPSYGCIRMRNEDVIDLYDRLSVGASVMMAP